MLKVSNLEKHYRDFSLNCSLEVRPGFVTGLIGPNGAGKSTTFKAVLGLIRPDGGTIEIFGKDRNTLKDSGRGQIGVVLSDSGFSEYLSVKDINLEGLCDDLYMIQDGHIVLHEETDTLLSSYGVIKVSEEQYRMLDKQYILCSRKETFGYSLLTDERQYYVENYPQVVVENADIDEVLLLMMKGEDRA